MDFNELLERLVNVVGEDTSKPNDIDGQAKFQPTNENLAKGIDLTTKEGLDKFNDMVDELHKSLINPLFEVFNGTTYADDWKEYAQSVYDEAHKNDKPVEYPERPSKKLPIEAGLQIHRLVQEYIDTLIKPYSNGQLTQEEINDAYGALYEFAAWIYLK